ncbi:MAG TPA: hypothetical protein VFV38_07625 [Ktedonobacteraceae bacterium]|nr:hypothetical protein [Ktedonobacteraceae bacterium]
MNKQLVSPPKQKRPLTQAARRKQLHLIPGPALAGYQIQKNEEHHVVVMNGLMVRCTPDEYRLLLRLLEEYERPVIFDELIRQFQDASHTDLALLRTARRKLTCTLSDLRAKLWPTDFTIVRVVDVGYLLIHQEKLWSITHADLNVSDEGL